MGMRGDQPVAATILRLSPTRSGTSVLRSLAGSTSTRMGAAPPRPASPSRKSRISRRASALPGADVVDLAAPPLPHEGRVGLDDVPDVAEIAPDVEVPDAEDGLRLAPLDADDLPRPVGADEIRRLPRPGVRERPGDDDVEAFDPLVESAHHLAGRLRIGVGVGDPERPVLGQGRLPLRGDAVDVRGADEQDARPRRLQPDGLEQVVRAQDVGLEGLAPRLPRAADVGDRRQVEDPVRADPADEVADVAFDPEVEVEDVVGTDAGGACGNEVPKTAGASGAPLVPAPARQGPRRSVSPDESP